MSYPVTLQPLVIEDEDGPVDAYKSIFSTISSENGAFPFRPAPPVFAFSYEKAIECLESSKIFHLVILDLRLPQRDDVPALEDQELGLDLLSRCTERDRYPIPALLVISGHIGSTEQTLMQDTLRGHFHYGRSFAKGDYTLLQEEIRRACREALTYSAVGIHLRASGRDQYPTLTPRDEDLLRRSVLQQGGRSGVDLSWWSAKPSYEAVPGGPAVDPWTKILMGRYLLDDGRGASRPKFFKLMPGSGARAVIESARQVEQKLAHIRVTSTILSKTTSLMVTEKVGARDARPKPLEEVLAKLRPDQVLRVCDQIVSQVRQLGDLLQESRPLKAILWPAHDSELLTDGWSRFKDEVRQRAMSEIDPMALYASLVASEERLRLNVRSLMHGDLHMGNVALDFDAQSVEAYIFDAGVTRRDVAGRDLAVLEVSVILHQRLPYDTVVEICSALYGSSDFLGRADAGALTVPAQNVVDFVRALRAAAGAWNAPDVYALMVFDFALIQMGGLMRGFSGNKIEDPRAAAHLLAVVAGWYEGLRTLNRHGRATDA
jgi:CheY-like chemotaxis protein